ncbi:cupin domain-containing protein [Candidatus Thorarchaeota archaeon]|nr:MAG: cupin domain-containing protein [Candidatus Thorarchaeota archaeon]
MVDIFRVRNSEFINRNGYAASYYADIQLKRKIDSAGFIFVKIPAFTKTSSHRHEVLEEVFIALNPLKMNVNNTIIDLKIGDIVLVEPNELHSIENNSSEDAMLLAIKIPNLKNDKIAINY